MNENGYDLLCWFDGSCGPVNPGGTARWGAFIKNADGEILFSNHGVIGHGHGMTNNLAEHFAAAEVLEQVATIAGTGWSVLLRGDSMLVVNQLNGKWRAKSRKPYFHAFQRGLAALEKLRSMGVSVYVGWLPRKRNQLADALSRLSTA